MDPINIYCNNILIPPITNNSWSMKWTLNIPAYQSLEKLINKGTLHPTSTPPGTCLPSRTGPSVTQVVPTSRSSVECTWDLKIRFIILTGNFSNVHPFPGLEPCYLEKVCSNCKGSSFRN